LRTRSGAALGAAQPGSHAARIGIASADPTLGDHGCGGVVDADGRLIVHRDIGLVLRNTDMTKLAQIQAARAGNGELVQAKDILGRDVLTVNAPVTPLGWLVFVEMPIEEAK
jgi:hypothetical protein